MQNGFLPYRRYHMQSHYPDSLLCCSHCISASERQQLKDIYMYWVFAYRCKQEVCQEEVFRITKPTSTAPWILTSAIITILRKPKASRPSNGLDDARGHHWTSFDEKAVGRSNWWKCANSSKAANHDAIWSLQRLGKSTAPTVLPCDCALCYYSPNHMLINC